MLRATFKTTINGFNTYDYTIVFKPFEPLLNIFLEKALDEIVDLAKDRGLLIKLGTFTFKTVLTT